MGELVPGNLKQRVGTLLLCNLCRVDAGRQGCAEGV